MFKIRIITPKGLYFEDEIESLTLKLSTGYRTILSGHAPLIGTIDYAPMHLINKNNRTIYYALHGGAINVTNEEVVLITNAIESKEEIDINRAKKAKDRAENRLADKDDNLDVRRAELALARAISRIKTFEN